MTCCKCDREVPPCERAAYGSFCEDCFVGTGGLLGLRTTTVSERRAVHAHAFYPFKSGQRRGVTKPAGQY
jgi:hypothetical protein